MDYRKFWRHSLGPLVTLALMVLNSWLISIGVWRPNVLLFYPLVIWANFAGGLRAGLLCAAMISVYSAWLDLSDPLRVIVDPISIFISAGLMGWQTYRLRETLRRARVAWEAAETNEAAARVMTGLNGNIFRIQESRGKLLDVLKDRPLDEATREDIHFVLHILNDLEQATAGWRALARLKAELGRDDLQTSV